VRCSPRLPRTINTNGAAGGCEDFYLWCQEVSRARRGWLIGIVARPLVGRTRSALRGWLGEVFSQVAPDKVYDWRCTGSVRLIKRPGRGGSHGLWSSTNIRYLFSLIFSSEKIRVVYSPKKPVFLGVPRITGIHKARFPRKIARSS